MNRITKKDILKEEKEGLKLGLRILKIDLYIMKTILLVFTDLKKSL